MLHQEELGPRRTVTHPQKPKTNRLFVILGILPPILFVLSLVDLNLPLGKLIPGTGTLFIDVGKMFPPDISSWQTTFVDAGTTLEIAIASTAISIVMSFLLAFLAAENTTPSLAVSRTLKGFASFLRGVPILVWALIFIVAVGPGPFCGVLSLLTHAVGLLIKVFSQAIEEVDDRVLEAMRASGATWLQTIGQGILPMAQTAFISWSALRLEFDISDAMTLGIVGAGGIGWDLENHMNGFDLHGALFIYLVIFFIVFTAELATNRIKVNRMKAVS